MAFSVLHTNNYRYEKIGSKVLGHKFNYIDAQKEHPIFVRARNFYLNQEWDKAKCEYEKLISINPNNGAYHHSYSCILSRFQELQIADVLKSAQKQSAIATALEPNNAFIRLTNIQFLTDSAQYDKVHDEIQIVFKQLLGIPDNTNEIILDVYDIIIAFEYYSQFLFCITEYEEAAKYLQTSINIRRKFDKNVEQRILQNLAQYYFRCEQIPKALDIISMMEQISQKTIWEEFQSVRRNHKQPWMHCKGEICLFIGDYQKAYGLLKCELKQRKEENQIYNCLLLYTELIECCIELKKFKEATFLNEELLSTCRSNPSIIDQPFNRNVAWQTDFLGGYYLIKKGGLNNAFQAVKWMEYITNQLIELNGSRISNRSPAAHYYLGLAYRNLSQYVNKQNYIHKAKFALFQAANLIPKRSRFMWEFALTLYSEGSELYLCKYFAKQSWKLYKKIINIAEIYPKMRKKLKKRLQKIKCNYCGKHKYLQTKKQLDKLKVCKGCHSFYYCNKRCQKYHWKRSHSRQCSKQWMQWNVRLLKSRNNLNQFVPFNQLKLNYKASFQAIDSWK
eukprot:448489_1